MSRIRGSRWPGTLGFGLALAAAPALLAASGALWVQVAAAGGGAVAATGGVWLMRFGWPNRRHSELHNLLMALGFFLLCTGAVAILAGVGLYH